MCAKCGAGSTCFNCRSGDDETASALERSRVVGVLDAWAERNECDPPHPVRQANGSFVVFWHEPVAGIWESREAVGATPDAARAAVARAIESGTL